MQENLNRLSGAAILSVFVCGTLVWLLFGAPLSGINDADVYLVYAQNFLSGHGFVHNVDGGQLEEFSSLLWMLVCAFFYMFSRAPEVPLLLLNLLFGIITVYICLKRSSQRLTYLVLFCSAPAWFAWCQIALVESGLWCLLLTATILAVSERNTSRAAWLLPLLALARPESMLWGCWLLLVLFLGLGIDRGWRTGLRAGFRPVFSFGMTLTVLLLFRGLYFGSVLPVSSGTTPAQGLQIDMGAGFLYLLGYLLSNPAVLLVVLLFGWVCVRELCRKSGLSRVSAVCLCLLPGLGIPLMAGDESFRAFRFYQPIWPLLCLVAAWIMPLLYDRQRSEVRRLAPAALMLAGWMLFALSTDLKQEFRTARQSREQGSVLARMFEGHTSLPSVGAMTAGGCKYAYPGRVYNLKGLTTAKLQIILAEVRGYENPPTFDHEVFHEWDPDILIQSEQDPLDRRLFKKLQSERWFQKRYLKGELWYNDEILFGYFSQRLLNGLEEGHYAFSQDLQYALIVEESQEISAAFPDETPVSGFAARDNDDLPPEFHSRWSQPQSL